MAEAEAKKESGAVKADGAPSMEEILQSIRGVISGDESEADDILELTELAEVPVNPIALQPEQAIQQHTPVAEPELPTAAPEKSILDDIDAALDNNMDQTNIIPQETPATLESTPEPKVVVSEPTADPVMEITREVIPEVVNSSTDIMNFDTEVGNDETIIKDKDETVTKDVALHKISSGKLLDEKVIQESSGSLKELVNSIHEKHVDSVYTRGGTSLETLVIEAMKPFLADWLNRNLPVIVKKIVEKEVKRLIPKEEDE